MTMTMTTPHSTTPPSIPLTTTFIPPSSCLDWTHVTANPTLYINDIFYEPNAYSSMKDCMPSGWNSSSYFSPGICPRGYFTGTTDIGFVNATASETNAHCCPTGYVYVPNTYDEYDNPEGRCTSPISINIPSPSSGQLEPTRIAVLPVSIRWQESDLPTSSSKSSAESLSPGAKAGIGVGVTVAVLLAVTLGFLFFLCNRRKTNGLWKENNLYQNQQLLERKEDGPCRDKNLPSHASWQHRTSVLLDSWFYETIAACFSISCFVAIFCTLLVYSNQKTPELFYGLTLNSVVSGLATATKSSLLFVVGECICQLRWISFKDKFRPLSHTQTYDSASRGPWGSFLILLQDKGQSLVTIGALITVLGLIVDPFVQQILTFPLRDVEKNSSAAIVKQSRYFTQWDRQDLRDTLNAAIWTGDFEIEPNCPSTDCTWPLIQSVELCTRCQDSTSRAKLQGCNTSALDTNRTEDQETSCSVSLPLGDSSDGRISMGMIQGYPTMSFPWDVIWNVFSLDNASDNGSHTFVGVENPLLVTALASLKFPEDSMSRASVPGIGYEISKVTECAMSICLKTYNVSVSGGSPSIHVEKEEFGQFYNINLGSSKLPDDFVCWRPISAPSKVWVKDKLIDLANFTFCGIQGILSDALDISGTRNWNYMKLREGGETFWYGNGGDKTSVSLQKVLETSLEAIMSRISTAGSKYAREHGNTAITGIITASESYVHVNWPWLALPAVLLALGIVLLISTALLAIHGKTSLWKSSVLPFLYHGLEKDLINRDDEYESVSRMEFLASAVRVKLGFTGTENRLMLHMTPETKIVAESTSDASARGAAVLFGTATTQPPRRKSV